MTWTDFAACRGLTDLFFAEHGQAADAAQARTVCSTCPVREPCLEAGLWEEFGVWGGTNRPERQRLRHGRTPPQRFTAKCGTPSGYQRHRRAGEEACVACRTAQSAAVAAYKRAKRDAS